MINKGQDSSVSHSLKLWAGQPRFDSWEEQEIFLFASASRPVLGLICSHQIGIRGSIPTDKADHSPVVLRLRETLDFISSSQKDA
jgi:hypothetical protein